MNKWVIRKLRADDIAYITSTWMNSYRSNNQFPHEMKHRIYSAEHNRIINSILSDAKVLVACDPVAEDNILGYLVSSGKVMDLDIIHYIYIKAPFQKFGVAKNLIETAKTSEKVVYTHKNQKASWIADKLLKNYDEVNYNPYLFFKEV